MNHLIILRELTSAELDLISEKTNTFYFFDQGLIDNFPLKGDLNHVNIQPEIKNKVNFEVLKALSKVPSEIVQNPILQNGLDQSIQYWYYHRFRAYISVRNKFYLVRAIESLQNEIQADLTIFNNDDLITDFFKQSASIKIKNARTPGKQNVNYIQLLKFVFVSLRHSAMSMMYRKRFWNKEHIIITSENQRHIDENTGDIQNVYLGRILDIGKDIGCIEQFVIPKIKGQTPKLRRLNLQRQKGKNPTVISSFVLLSTLLKKSKRKQIKNASSRLKTAYQEISKIESLPVRFLLKEVQKNHNSSLLYTLQYLGFKDFLKKSKAKTLSGIDENSPNTKSIFDAAKDLGIKTVGIQHGSIHPLNPAYIYSKEDLQLIQLPYITMLWGDYSKNILTKSSVYREEQVTIIGQPRTDYIQEKLKERNALISQMSSSKMKIIVFATQPQRDENLRKSTAIDVIQCAQKLTNVQLVLKIHPAEEKAYYEKIITEIQPKNKIFILKNEVDIYQILNIADLVLTCFSTVGAEAAILRKPLITVDYLDQDILEYSKMGIALKVTNKDTLFEGMKSILLDPKSTEKFEHDDFIQNFAYKIDGIVAERFWQRISEFSSIGEN